MYHFLQHVGNKPFADIRPVIGSYPQLTAGGSHLVLPEDKLGGPRPHNTDNLISRFFHGPGYGINRGDAHSAADTDNPAVIIDIRRDAQRPYKVLDTIPFIQGTQFSGSLAHLLENTGDGALFAVKISNGQGNPLTLVLDPEDNKLTGHCLSGHQRRFYLEKFDRRRKDFFF
ncbi:MAG: hypothetical protein BWY65_02199 [Firmicutes bacterium ADurb.Bin373]|nr:MAG: hypothetical protein BWY65_02199 [Firmicutes bacterium ADurb.Bin373]